MLILCNIRSVSHSNNKNVVYPVAGLGAAKQLAHLERSLRKMVTERIKTEMNLHDHGDDSVECCLCETSETRLGEIFDYFIRFQSLFYLSPLGVALVKHYGETKWTAVP